MANTTSNLHFCYYRFILRMSTSWVFLSTAFLTWKGSPNEWFVLRHIQETQIQAEAGLNTLVQYADFLMAPAKLDQCQFFLDAH